MDPLEQTRDIKPSPADLAAIAARCFAGRDGRQLLTYLRGLTLDRTLGPDAGDAHLRHLEGQRQLVQHIQSLVTRGRTGPLADPAHEPVKDIGD